MSMYKCIFSVLITVLLFNCASGVKRPDVNSVGETYILSKGKQVKEVSIGLSSAARKKHAKNLKFSARSHLPVVEILVTDMRVRSNFSAVAFGFLAGSDSVEGDVLVKDDKGKILNKFTVSASYALGGLAGGQDSARMGWLYEEFAKHTLNELQGIQSESEN